MGNASSKDTRFQLFIFEVISKCSGKKLNLKNNIWAVESNIRFKLFRKIRCQWSLSFPLLPNHQCHVDRKLVMLGVMKHP